MTTPPLPASPCLRVRLDYTNTDSTEAGSRFYLSYAGASPTGANCTSIASDIATAWGTDIAPHVNGEYALTEIDVLDIASYSGLSGQWTGSISGTDEASAMPAQCATNVEFDIARRYRGGKPRMFFPPPGSGNMLNGGKWAAAFITAMNAAVANFFAAVSGIDVGAVGTLGHVNLSYYSGFTNVTNSSGRTRAAPKYRPAALLDAIDGYATKGTIGSQRRRRTATTY